MPRAVDRFTGVAGLRRLSETLAKQPYVGGDRKLAARLAEISVIQEVTAGDAIISQGDEDADLFILLVGSVVVERNGRPGPSRFAGEHFGEMSVIDAHSKRSATVRAREACVVARISEPDFAEIAQEYPILWRCLAVEIAARLRQRLEDVPPKNDRPVVFVGSSTEGLKIAKRIKAGLRRCDAEINLWTDGIFEPSEATIESLEKTVRSSDIAVLILSPDDEMTSRGKHLMSPRDNVIFELGLFMGALGRTRVFFVRPRNADLKIPTDLLGVTPLSFDDGDVAAVKRDMRKICKALADAIRQRGPK